MTPLKRALSLAVPALTATLLLSAPAATASPVPAPALAPSVTQTASASLDLAAAIPPICYGDLPAQAHDTLDLIDQGGPFPYPQDGQVFQNREGILPAEPTGYYHEYTVITPGSPDRGARRIVTGESDEDYYTSDHYRSFKEVDYSC